MRARHLALLAALVAMLGAAPAVHPAHPLAAVAAAAASPVPDAPAELVPGRKTGSVTVTSFERVWKTRPESILLVDVRDPKEVKAGSIAGSINIPMNELVKNLDTLPNDKPVVFVCGRGSRAGEAYDTVTALGDHARVFFLDADTTFHADGSYVMVAKQ